MTSTTSSASCSSSLRGKQSSMSGVSATAPRARNQFVSTVVANVPLCAEHYRLVLRLPEFPATQPGQFIQIAGRDLDADDAREQACEVDWQPGRALDVDRKSVV